MLPIASFAASQLRKVKAACEACCAARAERGGPDHDATALVKSAKARRAELKELRERKKKQDAATRAAAANAAAATTENIPEVRRDAPSIDDGPSSKRAKPSADDGFVATERFDPPPTRTTRTPSGRAPSRRTETPTRPTPRTTPWTTPRTRRGA